MEKIVDIDLNVLGNKINNEKMRKAFFYYCADVAIYLSGDQHDDDEPYTTVQYADFLLKDATKLAEDIKRGNIADNMKTSPYVYPFDIGHNMVHITVKQLEKHSEYWNDMIKFYKDTNKEVKE